MDFYPPQIDPSDDKLFELPDDFDWEMFDYEFHSR